MADRGANARGVARREEIMRVALEAGGLEDLLARLAPPRTGPEPAHRG